MEQKAGSAEGSGAGRCGGLGSPRQELSLQGTAQTGTDLLHVPGTPRQAAPEPWKSADSELSPAHRAGSCVRDQPGSAGASHAELLAPPVPSC